MDYAIDRYHLARYRVYEYLLVLNPHEELWNKIMKVKEEFAEKYNGSCKMGGKPHITLVNFVQYEMMEERIINRLESSSDGLSSF